MNFRQESCPDFLSTDYLYRKMKIDFVVTFTDRYRAVMTKQTIVFRIFSLEKQKSDVKIRFGNDCVKSIKP